MIDPELYAKSNQLHIQGAKTILKAYGKSLSNTVETDSILDVGCGVGNITKDVLMPTLPNCKKLVGVDISTEMVGYARQNNPHDKISYEVLDIAGDVENFKKNWGHFAKIFSFYCLHWVKNLKKALCNIKSLLSTGGECFLVLSSHYAFFELLEIISKSHKWERHVTDAKDFVPNTQHSFQPANDFTQLMEDCELEVLNCEVQDMEFTFDTMKIFRDFVRAANPFVSMIPDEKKEDYITDCLEVLSYATTGPDDKGNGGYRFSYKLIVARARRAS